MEIARIIALQHHEKWNGKGYLGLKETEIALESRIVALADVFDALVSKLIILRETISLEYFLKVKLVMESS